MATAHLPIVPSSILRRYHVHKPRDHRFRAAARLLQSVWRSNQGFEMGRHTTADGSNYRLGSRLSARAAAAGANFIDQEIWALARRETVYREPGALIEEKRLFTNMLSSMPLCLNLLGPLKLNLELATRMFSRLSPEFEGIDVVAILFEHAPGRGSFTLTGDHTAWDTFIVYRRRSGALGFVAIELKYSEGAGEPVRPLPANFTRISEQTPLYRSPSASIACQSSLRQFYREHALAQAYLQTSDFTEGYFAVIAPALNRPVQKAVNRYHAQLARSEGHAPFVSWSLEEVVEQLRMAGAEAHAQWLHSRYLDWACVDQVIESSFAVAGYLPTPSRRSSTSKRPPVASDAASSTAR